jgi:hypothetical protein
VGRFENAGADARSEITAVEQEDITHARILSRGRSDRGEFDRV